MAKEEKTEGEEKKKEGELGDAPPVKNNKKRLMMLAIIGAGIIVILGGGFIGWKFFLHKGADEGTAGAAAEHTAKDIPAHIVLMDPFVVNLADVLLIPHLNERLPLFFQLLAEPLRVQTKTPQIR